MAESTQPRDRRDQRDGGEASCLPPHPRPRATTTTTTTTTTPGPADRNPRVVATSSSSKSALTIALQRAQSAVLLDSANNYPAAIAAYIQAVRLLGQVMARVDDGTRDCERKHSAATETGPREAESLAEWERRVARYQKKLQAKSDEARRLKVIHDTYQDRIRMLVQMGTPLPPPTPLSPSPPSFPSPASAPSHGRQPSTPTEPGPSTHPYAYAAPISHSPRPRGAGPSLLSYPDGDGRGIGAAMLELASPTGDEHDPPLSYPSAVGRRRATEPLLASLPVVVVATPQKSPSVPVIGAVAGAGAGVAAPGEEDDPNASPPPRSRSRSRTGATQGLVSPDLRNGGRRPSFASDSTAVAIARSVGRSSPRSLASSSPLIPESARLLSSPSPPLSPLDPVLADLDDGGVSPQSSRLGAPFSPTWTLAGPDTDAARLPPAPAMRRGASAGILSASGSMPGSDSRPRTGSLSLPHGPPACGPPSFAADMQRGYSTGSIVTPVRRGSSIDALAYIEEGAAVGPPVEVRPRPARKASLGVLPALSQPYGASRLVNSTTMSGTISQRRQARASPQLPNDDFGQRRDFNGSPVRGPVDPRDSSHSEATARGRWDADPADEFGRATDSALHESWTTGSLPLSTRLRSHSESRGRLGLPAQEVPEAAKEDERDSGLPPLPPLAIPPSEPRVPTQHRASPSASSISTSGPSRKGSMPTPTSLTASSLGRSTSASSIGSTASSSFFLPPHRRRSSARRLPGSAGGGSAAAHASTPSVASAGMYLSAGLAPPPDAALPASRGTALSVPPPRRPFYLMRLVLATLPSSSSSSGAYLSEKLFVPAQIWTTQGGAKLVALETKVRMLDLLSNGLDGVEKAGRGLLLVPTASASARAVARQEADRFARELDGFEGLMEGIESTLGKKLGPGVVGGPSSSASASNLANGAGGRKGSAASFASWSSKLSHSLNRVTNGTSLDSQAAYVDAIAKVFRQAACLDEHLATIFTSAVPTEHDSPYDLLDRNVRLQVERYLRRASEFFGHVICRFVLQDVGVLLDKYVKRGGAWLAAD